tara:strand:+ start:293 stop:772 length:480 start_codon:yes stop_codon:yes gene_type:complete
MALFGSDWSTYSDLALAEATIEAAGAADVFGPSINGSGTTGTMGHFCYFEMDGNTTDDYTKPFDFPVTGDLTIVINATAVNTDAATTLDVSMQGSVDGSNYVELSSKTDLLQDSDGTIDTLVKTAVYDYDAKGRMPYMRLGITAATPSNSTIVLAVVPH